MKQLLLICVFYLCSLLSVPQIKITNLERFAKPDTTKYDTTFVLSHLEYVVVNESVMEKHFVYDTIHSKDTVFMELPVFTKRILKIESLKND